VAILSLNLHCLSVQGTPYADNVERFDAVADLVVAEDVDALALQEVCIQGNTDALALLEQSVEDATGTAWTSAFTFAHVGWEGTPDEADEGVGLLVRGDTLDAEEITYVEPGALRRVALAGTLPGGLTLVTVHLDYDDADAREAQARQTATWALGVAGGLDAVVAGDLNDRATTPTHSAFLDWGYRDATEGLDTSRIDHVLVHRGAAWAAVETALVLTEPAVSDHPGVLVRLETAEPEPVVLTRLVADVDVGWGHTLSIRGDGGPLSWERGWWAYPTTDDRWELLLTEAEAGFAFKALVDDQTWQLGDDVLATPGDQVDFQPQF